MYMRSDEGDGLQSALPEKDSSNLDLFCLIHDIIYINILEFILFYFCLYTCICDWQIL